MVCASVLKGMPFLLASQLSQRLIKICWLDADMYVRVQAIVASLLTTFDHRTSMYSHFPRTNTTSLNRALILKSQVSFLALLGVLPPPIDFHFRHIPRRQEGVGKLFRPIRESWILLPLICDHQE